MALTATTLARAHTILNGEDAKRVTLTAATGAAKKMLLIVDSEVMLITDVSLTPTLQVVPGYTLSTAGLHAVGAACVFGPPGDFIAIGGPQSLSFGASGAITGPGGAGTIPVVNTNVFLTASGVGVYTLALPSADGTQTIDIFNATAQAHTVTLTGNPGTSDLITFVAALGGRVTLRANFGVWAIAGVQGATVA